MLCILMNLSLAMKYGAFDQFLASSLPFEQLGRIVIPLAGLSPVSEEYLQFPPYFALLFIYAALLPFWTSGPAAKVTKKKNTWAGLYVLRMCVTDPGPLNCHLMMQHNIIRDMTIKAALSLLQIRTIPLLALLENKVHEFISFNFIIEREINFFSPNDITIFIYICSFSSSRNDGGFPQPWVYYFKNRERKKNR